MRTVIFWGALLLFLQSSKAQIDYKGFPQWSWHKQDSTEYYLYTPSGIHKDSLYPIALALHGCCGENYHATLRNTVDPLVRMWHNFGENTQKVPTYIIAPATSQGWKQHIPNLKKVMDDLVQNHRGDLKRIYITGFSMGAEGTWEFLQQYPEYFAAAIPAGMNFHGDHQKIKDIPIWANRGETDYWANTLHKDIAIIRKLNGAETDTGHNDVTGINPRFTTFKGYDHGVQWVAASTQDLTGWAYSRINDGNKYPNISFLSPGNNELVRHPSKLELKLKAEDPDGSIDKIIIAINKAYHLTLKEKPYVATVIAPPGDAVITATAYDNKGKTNTATITVRSNIKYKASKPLLKEKRDDELVTNVRNEHGVAFPVSQLHKGSLTHFDNDGEVTVSNTAGYDGMIHIPGYNADTTRGEADYLSFNLNKDARIYIAYEKKDNLFTSTIPGWLKKWKKVPLKQIVAQYYYYDLYYKDFPKGKVTLQRPDRLNNNVNNNYFVLVSKR